MADDKTLTDNEDDIEVVEVAELPKPGETPPAKVEGDDDKGGDEGDDKPGDDEEDARLVADDDDEEEDAPDKGTPAHKKRVKRRQIQKQARDRTLAELAELREFKRTTEARFATLETQQLTQSESQIDERLIKTREDIALADRIMAKAMEAGNGDDFAAAMNMRDLAKAKEQDLLREKSSVSSAKESAPDTRIASLSKEWKTANATWYGVDQSATTVANQIDSQVAADGYNPATPAYWQELSRRLQARFQPPAAADTPGRKKPPPQGQSREHVPQSTRREVYVTPERKQAMVEAGIWDDIPRRNKMLKAYADYDRDQSAS